MTLKLKNIKEIKIDRNTYIDLVDLANIANTCATLIECPGGRLVPEGLICPHCESDYTNGDCKGEIKEPKDIPTIPVIIPFESD